MYSQQFGVLYSVYGHIILQTRISGIGKADTARTRSVLRFGFRGSVFLGSVFADAAGTSFSGR